MNPVQNYYPKREVPVTLKVNCLSFLPNGRIPARYTCDGINISPAIYIEGLPAATKTLALIMEDPDVPHDSFCHWVVWNLPVVSYIREKEHRGVTGINDFGNHNYNGPHPFTTVHRYFFKVFALDTVLDIPVSSTKAELKQAMRGHVLGYGSVAGKYQKNSVSLRVTGDGTKPLVSEELETLAAEKGKASVSMVFPLQHKSVDENSDRLHLSKVIDEAYEKILERYPSQAHLLTERLKKLAGELHYHGHPDGVGLYVSENVSFSCCFPFRVTEKTVVGNSFYLKELFMREQYAAPFKLLFVDDKEIRLYAGRLNEMEEVRDGEFPLFSDDEYETELPQVNPFFARNTLVRNGYANSYDTLQAPQAEFFERADELLRQHLQEPETLILCGLRKNVAQYLKHSRHRHRVIGVLYGNYSRFSGADFCTMAWPSIRNYIDGQVNEHMKHFHERNNEGCAATGIAAVWEAVSSGRGETLLVEQNFAVTGFLEEEGSWELHLHPPKQPHIVLDDAVHELLRLCLHSGVKIVFTPGGFLRQYQHAALTTRF